MFSRRRRRTMTTTWALEIMRTGSKPPTTKVTSIKRIGQRPWRRSRGHPPRLRQQRARVTNQHRVLGLVGGGGKKAMVPLRPTWERTPPSITTRSSRDGSTRRLERTHRSLHHLLHPPEHRQRHRTGRKGLPRPQEAFLLLRGRRLLLTFRHPRLRLRRGSDRTWCHTIHNPYH